MSPDIWRVKVTSLWQRGVRARYEEMVGSSSELANIANTINTQEQKETKRATSNDVMSSLEKQVVKMESALVQLVDQIKRLEEASEKFCDGL